MNCSVVYQGHGADLPRRQEGRAEVHIEGGAPMTVGILRARSHCWEARLGYARARRPLPPPPRSTFVSAATPRLHKAPAVGPAWRPTASPTIASVI